MSDHLAHARQLSDALAEALEFYEIFEVEPPPQLQTRLSTAIVACRDDIRSLSRCRSW